MQQLTAGRRKFLIFPGASRRGRQYPLIAFAGMNFCTRRLMGLAVPDVAIAQWGLCCGRGGTEDDERGANKNATI
jgi:hypothetical protein